MSSMNDRDYLKIDPWVASSLLQKAIRRGDGDKANLAAQTLFRLRGRGIWKRLVTIAFEDIGLANPKLLLNLVSLASDGNLRSTIGSENELLADICCRLAQSPKDRSADYLYSAATRWEPCLAKRAALRSGSLNSLLSIGSDVEQNVFRRGIAILELLTVDGEGEKLLPRTHVRKLFGELFGNDPSNELSNATYLAAQMRAHPFILMPLLLQPAYMKEGVRTEVKELAVEPAGGFGGVPLYAFDKFTSLGKRAIGQFAEECAQVRSILEKFGTGRDRRSVAEMAVFYSEGYFIARRFCWNQSECLENIGRAADFAHVRANPSGVAAIVDTVSSNLSGLNEIRRQLLSARRAN